MKFAHTNTRTHVRITNRHHGGNEHGSTRERCPAARTFRTPLGRIDIVINVHHHGLYELIQQQAL